MGRLAAHFTLILLLAAPAAAQVGTCVTDAGVRLAPWTDGHDPACGDDCGLANPFDDGLCAADGSGCLEGGDPVALAMPRPLGADTQRIPAGPRCIDDDDLCGSGAPSGVAGVPGGAAALAPTPLTLPPRARGLLPGATAAWPEPHALERDGAPEPRPPRSSSVLSSTATV